MPDQIAAPETEKRSPREQKPVYGIMEIMKILPHRYPFLLVDRIIKDEQGNPVRGANVSILFPGTAAAAREFLSWLRKKIKQSARPSRKKDN